MTRPIDRRRERLARPDIGWSDADKARVKPMILELMRQGALIPEIGREPDMPSRATIYAWIAADPDFSAAVDAARTYTAVAQLDEAREYMLGAVDGDTPDLSRARVAALNHTAAERYASLIDPKRFGQLVKHTGQDGGPLQIQVVNYGQQTAKEPVSGSDPETT